jgi:endonuclease/exonuclease/phosphatase family metal-dependent hydrolase
MKRTFAGWKEVVALVVFGALMLPRVASCQNAAAPKETQSFRVMTYNIHHAQGLDGKIDLARIAALIQQEHADIVAVQEVDRGVERTGRRDLPAELAKLTGMSCIFTNNIRFQGGEYGNAVLSRFPVQQWTNTHLTMIKGKEQRGILQVSLQVQGRDLVFLATHLDSQLEAERVASAAEILKLIQPYAKKPMLLCGDLNTVPGSQTCKRLAEQFTDSWSLAGSGAGNTIPAEKPNRRIDYIWFSKEAGLKPLKAWVPESEASDHRPVVTEFRFE